ncbi:hypothetical protein [Nitriliruptor alkaliphilus]|uniref:hypothetical protein n=1 Tax=Nitriliruptor alkaliphilus TaxID=427918 RepID=UPI0012EEDBE7|nr:hypothetical protein [Nitriliruptor alkaliphilus]
MRYARRTRSLAALAALAVLVPSVGASAADTGDVTVELTVDGASPGGLSIEIAAGTATLSGAPGGRVDVALPESTIRHTTDGGWAVQVAGTARVHGDAPSVQVPSSAMYAYLPFVDLDSTIANLSSLSVNMTVTGGSFGGPDGLLADDDLGAPYNLVTGTTSLNILGTARMSYTPQLGVRLLEAPADLVDDPRAQVSIIDELAPGATIERRVRFSNGDPDEALPVRLYATSASVVDGDFRVAEGRVEDELTGWITISAGELVLEPCSGTEVTVTIAVPADAEAGERYGLVAAEHLPAVQPDEVVVASRIGVRTYLHVAGESRLVSSWTWRRSGRAVIRRVTRPSTS